jgi:hypothetical protein
MLSVTDCGRPWLAMASLCAEAKGVPTLLPP